MKEKKEENFFKKVLISIKDFERYPELASKNWNSIFSYLLKLLAIFAIIATISFIYLSLIGNEVQGDSNKTSVVLNLLQRIREEYPNANETFVYSGLFVITYISVYVAYIISVGIDVLLIGAFGYFTALMIRIHLKYSAMCKMAVHALTLPIILRAICILLKTFMNIRIQYFDVMYIAIAYIYMVAAILMIKSDIIKNQEELSKILQEQQRVREELERKEKEEKQRKEQEKKNERKDNDKDEKDKEDNKEENKDNDSKGEPEGENA